MTHVYFITSVMWVTRLITKMFFLMQIRLKACQIVHTRMGI